MKRKHIKYLLLLMILLLMAMHLPFMQADPSTEVDVHTRGAWTDEGIYAAQLRNFLVSGTFDLHENSTFVRGPFLGVVQLPFFLAFGSRLEVARAITLFLILLLLLLFFKNKRLQKTLPFVIPLVFLQYHIFAFSHYGMSEMMCLVFVLYAFYFSSRSENESCRQSRNFLFLASLFLFFSYATKIQYLYVAGILPGATLLRYLSSMNSQREFRKKTMRAFFYSSLFAFAFFAFYMLAWYLPNAGFYKYIMLSESFERYHATAGKLWEIFRFNAEYIIWKPQTITILVLLFALLPVSILMKKENSPFRQYTLPIFFSIAWFLLEWHKLPMNYLPQRYLLGFYISTGLIVSFVLVALWNRGKSVKLLVSLIVLIVLASNLYFYGEEVSLRTYDLKAAREYFHDKEIDGENVPGAWASSFTWGSKALTRPVWYGYFNYEDPINTFKPVAIVAEDDQSDSDRAYESQGIDLVAISDSVRYFKIWRYKVGVYWIGKDPVPVGD